MEATSKPLSFREAMSQASRWVRLKVYALLMLGGVVIAGTVWIVISLLRLQVTPPAMDPVEVQKRIPTAAPEYAFSYEMKYLSFHLTNHKETRLAYAQLTLVLDCPDQDAQRMMQLNYAKLIDIVLRVGSTFYVEDFGSPHGFESFKGSLLAHFKAEFKSQAPRAIVIRDWILN
jgi:hypothetical protein